MMYFFNTEAWNYLKQSFNEWFAKHILSDRPCDQDCNQGRSCTCYKPDPTYKQRLAHYNDTEHLNDY